MEGFEKSEKKAEGSFEQKFRKREKVALPGGMAEVLYLKAEDPKSELPVFLSPGFAGTINIYEPGIKILHEKGRDVLTLDQPRHGGQEPEIEEQLKGFEPEDVKRTHNILSLLEARGVDRTDGIGNSEGALNLAMAAYIAPEKFRNLVLVAPAGLMGEDSAMRITRGFVGQFIDSKPSLKEMPVSAEEKEWAESKGMQAIEYPEIKIKDPLRKLKNVAVEGALFVAKNPSRALKEGYGLTHVDIRPLLRELHERGIGIVIMSSVDDPLFPVERMAHIAKADMLDGFLAVRGGHAQFSDTPETHMLAAEQMLTALEEKQRKAAATPDTSA